MRWTTLLGPVALITALTLEPIPASAQQSWCALYNNGTENCYFSTLAQCRATVSGVGGTCIRNPYHSAYGSN